MSGDEWFLAKHLWRQAEMQFGTGAREPLACGEIARAFLVTWSMQLATSILVDC